jgi:uncharacterized protein (DUF1015 family)
MATIRPFAALRPRPDLAPQICELPYDVMSSEEARAQAAGNPLSFLHVSKPEIDLSVGTDIYAPQVYAQGAQNFRQLISRGALRQDPQPCFYLYRQVMGSHSQVGIAAVASCDEYSNGIIKKHELTRPDKEDDRLRHIESLNAQTGPVFLVFRSRPGLDELVKRRTALKPAVDFTAPDGVRHSAWVIGESPELEFIHSEFAALGSLYIADGHHRCAAAARAAAVRRGAGQSSWFLSVIFPHDQVQILPYNRVVRDLNGVSPEDFLNQLEGVFLIGEKGKSVPARKHEIALYLQGSWRMLHFRPRFVATTDPLEKLDVTLLQKYVLEPILGILDPRTSQRISFVGGIRGVGELENLVDSGESACAFSMFPTGIEDLMKIADLGGIMPPKSTWFEPKLRDAMFSHLL